MLHSTSRDPSHSAERFSRPRSGCSTAPWRWLSPSAVLLTTLLSSAPAAADGGSIDLAVLEPDAIAVQSNGSQYTAILGHPLAAIYGEAGIHLDAGDVGRVKSWSVWLELNGGDESLSLREYGVGKSYGTWDRPKRVNRTEQLVAPQSAYGQWIVDQCNRVALSLRNSGQSNKAIFGEDRKVILSVDLEYTYDFTGAGSGNPLFEGGGPQHTIEVTCKKWEGITAPVAGSGLSAEPTVNSAFLSIQETSGAAGACMIKLSGIVGTSSPNMEVRYRYEDDDGHESDVQTVTTDHSKTVLFLHQYDVPNNPDGPEKGRVRIVGVSHAFKSAWAAYDMNCGEPGATDLSAVLPPTLTLSVGAIPNNSVMIDGQVCPKQVRLAGKIKGNGHFHGYAMFHGTSYLSPPQSYEVENVGADWVFAIYDLNWGHDINQLAVADTNGEPMQQTVKFGFNVNGTDTPGAHTKLSDAPVATVPLKPFKFACQFPKVTPGIQGGNGLTGQLPAPPAQQQTGQALAVNPQVAAAALPFSIQSPRGVVQQGVIRLQGVANKKAKFVLSWSARKNGAYKPVHANGLPETMTGVSAKFDIKALSAGFAWRLQVCPQNVTSVGACQHTDFKAPTLQN